MSDAGTIFGRLMAVIHNRKLRPRPDSYTTRLLDDGVEAIGAKITEEAAEVVEAAVEPGEEGQRHLVHEAADLIYHLFVMLEHRDVTLVEVEAELTRRFGTSGLAEKASRSAAQPPETS